MQFSCKKRHKCWPLSPNHISFSLVFVHNLPSISLVFKSVWFLCITLNSSMPTKLLKCPLISLSIGMVSKNQWCKTTVYLISWSHMSIGHLFSFVSWWLSYERFQANFFYCQDPWCWEGTAMPLFITVWPLSTYGITVPRKCSQVFPPSCKSLLHCAC